VSDLGSLKLMLNSVKKISCYVLFYIDLACSKIAWHL
jgi:hypothetical protein